MSNPSGKGTYAAENVIGGILIAGEDAYWKVSDLKKADFTNSFLADAWETIVSLVNKKLAIDVVTVEEELESSGVSCGGELISLASNTASIANIRNYADILKEASLARNFKRICAIGAESGDLAGTQASISALLGEQPSAVVPAAQFLNSMWDSLIARYEGKEVVGHLTGYPLLDEWTGGLQPGRVYGIGARPKIGKSVMALLLSKAVAKAGLTSAIWSLEMPGDEVMMRLACSTASVDSVFFKKPKMFDDSPEEMAKLGAAIAEIKGYPLWICDRTDVTIEEIEAQARMLHSTKGLGLLCIDYLGLIKKPKMNRDDLAVAHITRRLKIIAKDLHIPVLFAFQLNRNSESGETVRPPRPSDARDAGSIEQDLDVMILLHRPSLYDQYAQKGLRLDVALNRCGPTGLIKLEEDLRCYSFRGGDERWQDAQPSKGKKYDL